jgi:hypothetical protein
MKRILLSLLFLVLATTLFADPVFSNKDWSGAYSFHFDGTAFNNNGTFLADVAAVGTIVLDGNGNVTGGTRSIAFGNSVSEQTLSGTYTINPNGTGHAVVTHNPGNLVQGFDVVLTDEGRKFVFNATASGIPNVFVIAQGDGEKQ